MDLPTGLFVATATATAAATAYWAVNSMTQIEKRMNREFEVNRRVASDVKGAVSVLDETNKRLHAAQMAMYTQMQGHGLLAQAQQLSDHLVASGVSPRRLSATSGELFGGGGGGGGGLKLVPSSDTLAGASDGASGRLIAEKAAAGGGDEGGDLAAAAGLGGKEGGAWLASPAEGVVNPRKEGDGVDFEAEGEVDAGGVQKPLYREAPYEGEEESGLLAAAGRRGSSAADTPKPLGDAEMAAITDKLKAVKGVKRGTVASAAAGGNLAAR
jgi:hypothetical protein